MEFKRFDTIPSNNEAITHYYNLLAAYTDFANSTPELNAMQDKVMEIQRQLNAMFNPKEDKLFQELEEATDVRQSFLYEQCFIAGFKAAMRLTMESFT